MKNTYTIEEIMKLAEDYNEVYGYIKEVDIKFKVTHGKFYAKNKISGLYVGSRLTLHWFKQEYVVTKTVQENGFTIIFK